MCRDASRILLKIIDVRVERLRDSVDLDLLDELGDMLEDCDSVAGKEFSRIEHLQSVLSALREEDTIRNPSRITKLVVGAIRTGKEKLEKQA